MPPDDRNSLAAATVNDAFIRTAVGKKRLVRNILNVIATVKVPRKSIRERRNTSGTALVMYDSWQASPIKLQPRSTHSSSVTQCRLTSTLSLLDRQFVSSFFIQSSLYKQTVTSGISDRSRTSRPVEPTRAVCCAPIEIDLLYAYMRLHIRFDLQGHLRS